MRHANDAFGKRRMSNSSSSNHIQVAFDKMGVTFDHIIRLSYRVEHNTKFSTYGALCLHCQKSCSQSSTEYHPLSNPSAATIPFPTPCIVQTTRRMLSNVSVLTRSTRNSIRKCMACGARCKIRGHTRGSLKPMPAPASISSIFFFFIFPRTIFLHLLSRCFVFRFWIIGFLYTIASNIVENNNVISAFHCYPSLSPASKYTR